MSYYSAKEIQEAIDKVESLYKNKQYIMFAYSEEHKEMLQEYFPNYDIRVLPQYYKTEENKDKVYIIPMSDDKPIKFVYDD